MLVTVYIASTRRYLGFDDLVTAMLVSEPNLIRMLKAIGHGVEVNPPLFFILEWMVARLAGTGDFALRVLSGLSIAVAVPVLYVAIRRVVKPEVAALAVGFVIGLSRDVYEFATWARYYGWLILLTAVAGYLFMRSYTESDMRKRDYAYVFLTHCAIVYTHLWVFL